MSIITEQLNERIVEKIEYLQQRPISELAALAKPIFDSPVAMELGFIKDAESNERIIAKRFLASPENSDEELQITQLRYFPKGIGTPNDFVETYHFIAKFEENKDGWYFWADPKESFGKNFYNESAQAFRTNLKESFVGQNSEGANMYDRLVKELGSIKKDFDRFDGFDLIRNNTKIANILTGQSGKS